MERAEVDESGYFQYILIYFCKEHSRLLGWIKSTVIIKKGHQEKTARKKKKPKILQLS